MKRMEVFYSDLCVDCHAVVPQLRTRFPEAEFYNITSSMVNLKRFLLYRDSHPAFEEAQIGHYVGIPAVVCNGGEEVYLELDSDEVERIAKWFQA